MNNTFDIKRFGNYLVHDLRNAWRTVGLSGLIVAASPLIFVATLCITSLISNGRLPRLDNSVSVLPTIMFVVFLIVNAPVKMYGRLTERRVGSDWTLLPASAAEKTISMIITAGIIVPLLCTACFLAFEFITDLIIPTYDMQFAFTKDLGDKGIAALLFNTVAVNVFWFLLGAIYFKSAKAAKTILALFVLGGVLSTIIFFIVSHIDMASGNGLMGIMINSMEKWDNEKALSAFKWAGAAFNFLEAAVIAALCYWRIRTIQH